MHQPYGDVYGQWRAMRALQHKGRIPDRAVDLVDHNDITPAVNRQDVSGSHAESGA
ncbi:hypothetical protein SAMN05444920_102216 [Nonomuraea solani]|uniref:Uncharacterized protein n=1 Tax=Nonomuraea solani TaxID=1144553 RepID=A0A1H5YCZ1_9ACTN|nr:hypothetical protein [Nonomuraea solani]SEG21286.1 hypothetical protein SAMN05444920_102216 [Nonomuraea solani]